MKKITALIFCISVIICLSACAHISGTVKIGNFKEYKIGDYEIDLPETYKSNDLKEVKAEPNCIAMLSDSNGKLPDLWIYEDKCLGNGIKEHIFTSDQNWNYKELSVYQKDGKNFAKASYDEQWYDQSLINEHFYRIEKNGKVLSFDFAFEKHADYAIMHSYVLAIASALGF